jgi:hypothetical protein
MKKYIGNVKHWKSSSQRYRWIACALLEIEQRMRRINNYDKLDLLKKAVNEEVKMKLRQRKRDEN